MPAYRSTHIVDNGLQAIVTAAGTENRIAHVLIENYTTAMTYAQAMAAALASVSLTPADLTINNDGTTRRLVIAPAASVPVDANSGATPDLHQAIVDTVEERIELVTDETNNQVMYEGNTTNLDGWEYRIPAAGLVEE